MDWLGAFALIIGIILIILGVGLTFKLPAVLLLISDFLGILAIIFGILLAAGGYMLVRGEQ